VAGREIALYSVGDEVFATDNLCTHGPSRLCDGFLLDHEIECPLHQGRFDIRSGQPTCEPVTVALRTYPVRIEGGRVFLRLD
jgi:naphthalene 1,2-dioxygenase system ferredoxin subunit